MDTHGVCGPLTLQVAQKKQALEKLRRDSKDVILAKKTSQKMEVKNLHEKHKAELKSMKKVRGSGY